ncbi:MAG: aminopeptidase P family protein, partial [Planctomycetes bacterium]|nr:aminopeptidase P family protein [Planctomycetota bacterium]
NLQSAQREIDSDPYDGRVSREAQFMARLAEKHGVEVKDFTVAIDALRVTKTEPEIQAMRRACEIAAVAHNEVMRTARPGEYEWQQAARMLGHFRTEGAMGAGYEAIVGSGPNAIILHYNLNNRKLLKDEVVMIDYGPEFRYTVADISRSWPTSAKFTARQREVYEAVYAAQEAAFAECKPGSNLSQVHQAAMGELAKRGFQGKCNHGVSHWLGMATHDVGRGGARFKPGMMFTVEPGVYLPDEGIGVRLEDIVVITESGFDLVSSSVPRDIDEIESMRAEAFAD